MVFPVGFFSIVGSRSEPGIRSRFPHPLVDVMKMTPASGSAAGGPVMFTPPMSPGQYMNLFFPSGFPRCTGGLKNGENRSFAFACASARCFSSGV